MAEDRPSPASPVCYLDEALDAYAGYFTIEESHAMIRRWRAQASRADIVAKLAVLLPVIPEGCVQTGDDVPLPRLTDTALQAEIRQSLPKFRDDAVHRALSEIADRL